MPREFKFRGYTIEQLEKMSLEELARLFKSNIRRHVLRGLTPEERALLKKVKRAKRGEKIIIKTHAREAVILPIMVGLTIYVHNGKDFVPIEIRPEMVGHRLGEFAITCREVKHGAPGVGATRSSFYVPLK